MSGLLYFFLSAQQPNEEQLAAQQQQKQQQQQLAAQAAQLLLTGNADSGLASVNAVGDIDPQVLDQVIQVGVLNSGCMGGGCMGGGCMGGGWPCFAAALHTMQLKSFSLTMLACRCRHM